MNINLTLFGQLFSFGLFVWFCMKYVWPPIINALEERKKKIAESLSAAEDALVNLKNANLESDTLTKEAKDKANKLLVDADSQAKAIILEARNAAKEEAGRELEKAKANMEQSIQKTKSELQQQLSSLVIAGASQIVAKEIDEKQHSQLINDLIKQI